MTFDEWNAEPYARTFEDAWKAGAASRDAEIAEANHAHEFMSQQYNAVIKERDQLREQVTMLRDALTRIRDRPLVNDVVHKIASEALAATEPKE